MSTTTLSLSDQKVLWRAVRRLERDSLVERLSELTGQPMTQLLRWMPGAVSRRIHNVVQRALWQALEVALFRIDAGTREPGPLGFSVISGITGGVSGFFGIAAMALELPVTTTLMLRSIASAARKEGEDLHQPGARLACLEVFALGSKRAAANQENLGAEASYYAARAFLAKAVSDAAEVVARRTVLQRSSPVIVELLSRIGTRFGFVVSERVAAGAIPVIGAIGGAVVNLAFMDHFQRMAQAHFAIRRMEREHGLDEIRGLYERYARALRERDQRA